VNPRRGLPGAAAQQRTTVRSHHEEDHTANDGSAARARLLDVLLTKVAEDLYPSSTLLDFVEKTLEPDDVDACAAVLIDKIADETYPSVSIMRRLVALTET
jgi:hypothetical protein